MVIVSGNSVLYCFFFAFTDEVSHMISLTQPSVMFCDIENLSTLKEALDDLQMSILIFVFGAGGKHGVRLVEELFCKTGDETYFM